jgi:predicted TIM-barrel fold metal-dependent hydrolase
MAVVTPPVVDIHTHAFTDSLAPRAVVQLAEQSGLKNWHDGTVSGLAAAAEAAGIDVCVVQPVATKPTQVCTINDWALASGTERIRFFGSMHPDFEDPAEEIARIARLGLRGIKLHTEYQAFKPDEERMAPIYEACIENGMYVLFHAGADEFLPTLYGRCDRFVRMLERWPAMRTILAHMGGYQQWKMVLCDIVGRDCWLDTSYALGYMPQEDFLEMVAQHGYERVLFGSDSPWDDMGRQLHRLRDLPLPVEQIEAIAGGNAAGLLGL